LEQLFGKQWTCSEHQSGFRLDKFLSVDSDFPSRSKIQEWIKENGFTVNGKSCKKNVVLKTGDVIEMVGLPPGKPKGLLPQNIPVNIVFQDESLVVLNKPSGMVVHPGNGIFEDTLANGLAHHFKDLSNINGPLKPGIIHRLDKDTSGLLVIAKTNQAHKFLANQLKDHTMKRVYCSLAWRQLKNESGTIDKNLSRQKSFRIRRIVSPDGQTAITHYKVLEYFNFATYVQLNLETGRTHQIRAHLASIGNPIVGDTLYGGNPYNRKELEPKFHSQAARLQKILKTQALHAMNIRFVHPETKKPISFEVPIPNEMEEALDFLRDNAVIENPMPGETTM